MLQHAGAPRGSDKENHADQVFQVLSSESKRSSRLSGLLSVHNMSEQRILDCAGHGGVGNSVAVSSVVWLVFCTGPLIHIWPGFSPHLVPIGSDPQTRSGGMRHSFDAPPKTVMRHLIQIQHEWDFRTSKQDNITCGYPLAPKLYRDGGHATDFVPEKFWCCKIHMGVISPNL